MPDLAATSGCGDPSGHQHTTEQRPRQHSYPQIRHKLTVGQPRPQMDHDSRFRGSPPAPRAVSGSLFLAEPTRSRADTHLEGRKHVLFTAPTCFRGARSLSWGCQTDYGSLGPRLSRRPASLTPQFPGPASRASPGPSGPLRPASSPHATLPAHRSGYPRRPSAHGPVRPCPPGRAR